MFRQKVCALEVDETENPKRSGTTWSEARSLRMKEVGTASK